MAGLQSYSVRGNSYWRIVESFRDKGGRPRIRVVRHLGTAEKLLERLSEAPGRPLYAEERERTLGHSSTTGYRSNHRYPCTQTKPGTFGGRVPPSCRPEPGAGAGQQTQAQSLVPEYHFGPAPSAAPGRSAQSTFLGSHELSGRLDVGADRKRHHAATGGGMEGRSTNAVLRHHQLRHVPFLGEPRT